MLERRQQSVGCLSSPNSSPTRGELSKQQHGSLNALAYGSGRGEPHLLEERSFVTGYPPHLDWGPRT